MLSFTTALPILLVNLPILVTPTSAQPFSSPNSIYQCPPENTNTTYPSKCHIAKVFNYLYEGNDTAFFSQVAPDVQWTLMGTHPLAGEYHNRTIFITDALQRLGNTLDLKHPSTLALVNVVGGGDEEWSVQELHGLGVCKNGLNYDNRFSWVTRWNTEGIIVEVRAYLDSALVYKAITENESGEYTYTDQRTTLVPGPVGANCAASA